MEFLDNTGHIFTLPSYEEKPIGYEYEEQPYIFWIDNESSSFLSINNYYARTINILVDLTKFGLDIHNKIDDYLDIDIVLDSKVYKLANPIYLQETVSSNSTMLDIVDISEHCSQHLTNEDLFILKLNEQYVSYAIIPLYIVGYVSDPGTWISNILIHVQSKPKEDEPIVNEWCPISIGGQFQDDYEELIIHGQNMGVRLPKDILRGVYQASFINDNFNETLYNQKVKEFMINFMNIRGELGNFNAAINGMNWFGYGDKLTISKLLNTDNNIKQQYLHDYFSIHYDLLDSFKTFRNSTYIALRLKINIETGKYEKQAIDMMYEGLYKRILNIEMDEDELIKQDGNIDAEYENDWKYIGEEDIRTVEFAGEGNPILEDLLSKQIKIKVGHKNEQYDYITSFFNFSMNELGIKLSCMKYYYEKYFLPIHLKIHSASLTHKVYANDLKMTSVNRVGWTENPICTEDTDYDVIFPADHVHYFKKQTHYVDDNMNEFSYYVDQPDRHFFYICDTCVNIPITFTSLGKYYDCVLLLEKKTPRKLHIQYIYNNDLLFNVNKQPILFDDKNQIVDFKYLKFAFKFYNDQKFSFVFNTYKEMIDYLLLNAEVHTFTREVENTDEIGLEDVNEEFNEAGVEGENKNVIMSFRLEGVGEPIELNTKTQFVHQDFGHYCYIVPPKNEIFDNVEQGIKTVKITKVRDYYIKIIPYVDYIETYAQYSSDNIYNDEISLKCLDEFKGFPNIVIKSGKEIKKFYQEESEKIFESHFRFIQTGFVNEYLNFIIYPYAINRNVDYWINNDFIIRLLVNNKWYNYEFTLKIPEFHVQLGKLQYKYWDDDINYLTHFSQIKYLDSKRIVFNSFMHEPELVTVNNINYFEDLIKCAKFEHLRYFPKEDFIQNGDFYKYIDFNGHKLYLHHSMWNRDIIIPIQYLIDKKDWKNLYMFYYSQFVYLYEESGTTNDETIEYIGKYWDILGENYGLLCEDSYENDDMMHLGLTIDRMHNDRPGYALRTNYVWIKYSNDYRGSFMCNHPYDENKELYKYIGISYNQKTSIESDDEQDYYWTTLSQVTEGKGIKEQYGGLYTWIKYASIYPCSDGDMYNVPNINTNWIGVAVNQLSENCSTNYKDYVWTYYKDGEGLLTNVDEKIFWIHLDENLDRYIMYTDLDIQFDDENLNYNELTEEQKKYVTKIYLDIPEITPILDIPLKFLNEEQLRLFIIRNYIYLVSESWGEKQLLTKYYLKNGRVLGEGHTGIILEDNPDITELVLEYVPDKPSWYRHEGKRYDIFESLHRTRTDILNEYSQKINIAPANKYLNSILLFDLYKKELNTENLTDNDNILNFKSHFKVLCQGIQFSNSTSNYGKIMLKGKQEFNGLTTDNIDLFSFYWNNKDNYDEINTKTITKGYYVYQVFDENYNIVPYKFSDQANHVYLLNYPIEDKYINFNKIKNNKTFGPKFVHNNEQDNKVCGIKLDNTLFVRQDNKYVLADENLPKKLINTLFIESFVTTKVVEEDGKLVEYYYIDNKEIVYKIKFLTYNDDGTYTISNTIKNVDYESLVYNKTDNLKTFLFIEFRLLERRNIKYAPININQLQSDRIRIKKGENNNFYMVVIDNDEKNAVPAYIINEEKYVKNNLEIDDNPGLFWIDLKYDDTIVTTEASEASKYMNDLQSLKMGSNIEISGQSVIESIDDYLKMIERTEFAKDNIETIDDFFDISEVKDEEHPVQKEYNWNKAIRVKDGDNEKILVYDGKDECEYYLNPYTYKNYLQVDLTGNSGLFKLYYETNYDKCRLIVYIVDKDGNSQIIKENNTIFELSGDEKTVLALFQIDKDDSYLNEDLQYYIKPYIYKLRYELYPIMYEDTYKNDWSKMKIRIYDTDLEYEIGNNTSQEVIKMYNDFFKEHSVVSDIYTGRYTDKSLINKDVATEDSIDDKNFKIQHLRFVYDQVVELSGLYLDYDLYLMHDFEKWHVIFISKQTCDKVQTPDQLNIKKFDDIEIPLEDITYVLKFVKHDKQFLINRMECNYTNGVNHFNNDDIVVGSIRNNKRLPIDLDISSKWNVNLMSIGKTKEFKVSSNNEMGIISIPNNDNAFESGYYNVDVAYSLNGMNQQESKQSSRFLIK